MGTPVRFGLHRVSSIVAVVGSGGCWVTWGVGLGPLGRRRVGVDLFWGLVPDEEGHLTWNTWAEMSLVRAGAGLARSWSAHPRPLWPKSSHRWALFSWMGADLVVLRPMTMAQLGGR